VCVFVIFLDSNRKTMDPIGWLAKTVAGSKKCNMFRVGQPQTRPTVISEAEIVAFVIFCDGSGRVGAESQATCRIETKYQHIVTFR
jgi:hypothetical protein